jgi:hypothetical protein
MSSSQRTCQRSGCLENGKQILPRREERVLPDVSDDRPELFVTQGLKVIGQGCIECEPAAGFNAIQFDAQPDDLEQVHVGRLDISELHVGHDPSAFDVRNLGPGRLRSRDENLQYLIARLMHFTAATKPGAADRLLRWRLAVRVATIRGSLRPELFSGSISS